MKVKVGDYIKIKTKEEMLKYKNSYGGYSETTCCGWHIAMTSALGTTAKVVYVTSNGNYIIEGFQYFISPDWCKTSRVMSFKPLYKEII